MKNKTLNSNIPEVFDACYFHHRKKIKINLRNKVEKGQNNHEVYIYIADEIVALNTL